MKWESSETLLLGKYKAALLHFFGSRPIFCKMIQISQNGPITSPSMDRGSTVDLNLRLKVVSEQMGGGSAKKELRRIKTDLAY